MSIEDTIDASRGPEYPPGASVAFSCIATGAVGSVTYQWSSTCSADCFVISESTSSVVSKDILHSVDSGNHTCTVTDSVGNTGSATIEVRVKGIDTAFSVLYM